MSSLKNLLDDVRKSTGYMVHKLIGQASKAAPQCADEMERLFDQIENEWIKAIEAKDAEINRLNQELESVVNAKNGAIQRLMDIIRRLEDDKSK